MNQCFQAGLVSVSFRDHSPEEILVAMQQAQLTCIEWGSDVHAPCADGPLRRWKTRQPWLTSSLTKYEPPVQVEYRIFQIQYRILAQADSLHLLLLLHPD